MFNSKPTILVTGAGGQLGSEFTSRQFSMYNLVTLDRGACDITDEASIKSAFSKYQPDIIVNTAAYTAVDRAEDELEQAFFVNANGPKNLACLCVKHKIPLIHLSTDYVFDGNQGAPYKETDQPCPAGVYGASKLAGEQAIQGVLDQAVILRVSWVFGQNGSNFVKTMLRLFHENSCVKVVNDQYGCPTSAYSIMLAIRKIIDCIINNQGKFGVFHYCNSPVTTWYEFAKEIFEQAKDLSTFKVSTISAISSVEYPTKATRPSYSVLDCGLIQSEYGLPQVPWREILNVVCKKLLLISGRGL